MVVRQALTLMGMGLAIGFALSLTLGGVSIVLLVAALPASLFPAYRAAHVEPASALRYE